MGATLQSLVEIHAIVDRHRGRIRDPHVFFGPDIPEKRLRGALAAYATDARPEDVLVLADDTVFGSGKDGLLLTGTTLYAREALGDPERIPLDEIGTLAADGHALLLDGRRLVTLATVDKLAVDALAVMVRDAIVPPPSAEPAVPPPPPGAIVDTPLGVVMRHRDRLHDLHVSIAPDIPPKKLEHAIAAYAPATPPDEVLMLVDATTYGSGKDGGLLTVRALHTSGAGAGPARVDLARITTVACHPGNVVHVNGMPFLRLGPASWDTVKTVAALLEEAATAAGASLLTDRIRRSTDVDFLAASLRDVDPDVRRLAADTLGRLEDPRAFEAIVTARREGMVVPIHGVRGRAYLDQLPVSGLASAGELRDQVTSRLAPDETVRFVLPAVNLSSLAVGLLDRLLVVRGPTRKVSDSIASFATEMLLGLRLGNSGPLRMDEVPYAELGPPSVRPARPAERPPELPELVHLILANPTGGEDFDLLLEDDGAADQWRYFLTEVTAPAPPG